MIIAKSLCVHVGILQDLNNDITKILQQYSLIIFGEMGSSSQGFWIRRPGFEVRILCQYQSD